MKESSNSFYEWIHWNTPERSRYMSKSTHLHPSSTAKTVVGLSNTHTAKRVSSLRHPSLRIPLSLSSAPFEICVTPSRFLFTRVKLLPHTPLLIDLGERTEPKLRGRTRFSARPVNTSTVKHRRAVILRGDSLTRLSLTHQLLLALTCCLTDFMHPYSERCTVENWPGSTPTHP